MTDKELKDLVANLAINQDAMAAEADKRHAEYVASEKKRNAAFDKRMEKRNAEYVASEKKRSAEADKRHAEYVASEKKRNAEFDKRMEKRNAAFDKRMAKRSAIEDKRHADSMKGLIKLEKSTTKLEKSTAKLEEHAIRMSADTDRLKKRIQELSDMYGGVSAHLGDEAELDFTQALKDEPYLSNITFNKVIPNLTRKNKNTKVEIDVFLLNGNSVAVVEVKRHLQSKHINDLHNKTIPNFLSLYPEYKNKKLYAALATYSIPKKAKPHVNELLSKYGYALITPDRTGLSVEVDTHCMRVLN